MFRARGHFRFYVLGRFFKVRVGLAFEINLRLGGDVIFAVFLVLLFAAIARVCPILAGRFFDAYLATLLLISRQFLQVI